jgi:hypothetical protein
MTTLLQLYRIIDEVIVQHPEVEPVMREIQLWGEAMHADNVVLGQALVKLSADVQAALPAIEQYLRETSDGV